MKKNDYDFTYTSYEAIKEDGKSIKIIFPPKNLVTKRLSIIHPSQQAASL